MWESASEVSGKKSLVLSERRPLVSYLIRMNRPVPILYLSTKPDLSRGGQRSLLHLIQHLDRDRFSPHVVVPEPGPLSRELFHREVAVYSLDWPPFSPRHPLRLFRGALALRQIIRDVRPAVIHADAPRNCHLAAWVRGQAKLVMHLRVNTPDGFSDKLLAQEADRLIAVTQAVSGRFTHLPVALPKLRIIYNAVDTKLFKPAATKAEKLEIRKTFDLPRKKVLVGFLAGFVPLKRHDFLLDLWKDVLERAPDICLVLAGDQPVEERERLARRIEDEGLSRWVKMIGFVDDPEKLLPGLDFVVLPSTEEGFGRVLIEGAACGLPAVASDIPGVNEAVYREHTGVLVPLEDRKAWVVALSEMANDSDRRERMGNAALKYVLNHFTLENQATQIMAMYDKLLQERR